MSYFIYRITSPSKKVYIGMSIDVNKRWASHKKRCRRHPEKRHPFYDAIRSYGHENFKVESILSIEKLCDAKEAEISQIAKHRSTERKYGYNISPGGDYDGSKGSDVFWERMYSNPDEFKEYRKKLSVSRSGLDNYNTDALIKYMKELPPKERWKRAYRASRVAKKAVNNRTKGIKFSKERVAKMSIQRKIDWENMPPSAKKRFSINARENAKKQWENRTDEEKVNLSESISETLKQRYVSDKSFKKKNEKQISGARKCIDRKTQGPAASKGLKKFWSDIKKDPVRYRAYLDSREATKRKNRNAKNDV